MESIMGKYKIMVKGIVQHMDQYLVVERWYDDNIVNPYQWEFVDGPATFGEAPDAAVLRLIEEYTGITADIDRILYTWTYMIGEVCHLGIAYLCLTGSDTVALSEDLHDYRWIAREEFDDFIYNKNMLEDLKRAEI